MTDPILEWLLAHYGQEQFQPGLSRINRALRPLLSTLSKSRIVTIAGTNGKGETTLRLGENLTGHTFCSWLSPHILRLTERFRDERGEISPRDLEALIQECHQVVREEKFELTFYEFLFFVFCTWASRKEPDFLLLEVGLGGRLDAVNAVDAELVLLPSISRDHQEFLGHRYDQILREKLGVLRKGTTLITYLELKYLREKTLALCPGNEIYHLADHGLLDPHDFSGRNQLLAHAAANYLLGKDFRGPSAFKNWRPSRSFLEHRGEILQKGAEWIFFGSHNVDGMRKLIQFLHSDNYNFSRPPYAVVLLAFSRRDDRDLRAMLRMLKGSGLGRVAVTCFLHPKALSPEQARKFAQEEGLEFVEDLSSYVKGTSSGTVLVTGSYYFLGALKSLLR